MLSGAFKSLASSSLPHGHEKKGLRWPERLFPTRDVGLALGNSAVSTVMWSGWGWGGTCSTPTLLLLPPGLQVQGLTCSPFSLLATSPHFPFPWSGSC